MLTEAELERWVPADDPELRALNARNCEPGRRFALAESRRLAAEQRAKSTGLTTAADVADLHRRVAVLEHTLAEDGDFTRALVEGVGSVLPRFVDKRLRESLPTLTGELTAKVNALAEKVADLEQRQLRFKGVWREGNVYEANSLVIKRGGLWIAKATTITPPGSSDDWCLCTKSGEVVPKEPVCA
jgi:hypothetical protein